MLRNRMLVDPTFLFKIGSEVYPEGTHFIISWFERPVIYDIRARPHLVESTSGSRDLQMATGEDYFVEPAESRRPFRALLDVGLIKTTIGNRVFGALKGALDGGLDIPHNDKRFAGFDKELDVEVHRKYVFGGHILAEDEPEKYQSHFSEYIKRGIEWRMFLRVSASFCKYNLKKLTYEDRKAKFISRVAALNSRCCR
ncbi:60S ribosomal protein L5 [Glycine soja]|uniref:60S ribosomal protein L5 n=1 Tax=Glycine soja TaxID=3848 RepID=A0A445FV99_GLYSO|nr:60S ribosomal protein L5 [Glycine soja]